MPINIKFDLNKKIRYLKPANRFTFWKVVALIIIGLLMAGTILIFYFVYQYTYITLSNANAIIVLNSSLGADVIDYKNFKISQDKIKLKIEQQPIPEKVRNIFYYVETATTQPITNLKKTR